MNDKQLTQDELKEELRAFLKLHGYEITTLTSSEKTFGNVKQYWIQLEALRAEISDSK